MTRGGKIVAFIEAYFLIPEGAQVGQPMRQVKFQKKFILDVLDSFNRTIRAYKFGWPSGKAEQLDNMRGRIKKSGITGFQTC